MLLKAATCLSLCLFFLAICATGQYGGQVPQAWLDSIHLRQVGPFHNARNAAPFLPSGSSPMQDRLQIPVASGIINRQQNTGCRDTAERFFLVTDTLMYYAGDPYPTADGNYLVSGQCQKNYAPYRDAGGFLMKFTGNGTILWNKNYDSANGVNYHWINYSHVVELQDGSILMAGYTSNSVNNNVDLIFTRTTSTGNVVWTKTYNSRLWRSSLGATGTFSLFQIKQDPASGDVYIAGSFSLGQGPSLIRLSIANGIIVWSRAYGGGAGSYHDPFGMDIKADEIKLLTKYSLATYDTHVCMYRVDKASGDTISTKDLRPIDTTGIRQQMITITKLTIRNNGNYLLTGRCYGYAQYPVAGVSYSYHATVIEVDSNFNFIRAYTFRNRIESNSYNTRISMYPDGSGYFTMLHYIAGYTGDVYSVQFKDGQIIRQRKKAHSGEGYPFEPQALQLSDGGSMLVRTMGDSLTHIPKIEVLKLHPTDTSSYCLGFDNEATSIATLNYVPATYMVYDSVRSNILSEIQPKTLVENNLVAVKQPGCVQISTCDSLKIRTAQASICQSQTLSITAYKNEGCGSRITWTYNTAVVSSAVQANDSTVAFHFNAPWSGYIYGSIPGCSAIVDSVYINVLQSPAALNLGPDTVICPGNTLVLNAHTGYATYQWQNGSTDSVFTVTQPGTYSISVTDACSGNTFKDTVMVLSHPPVFISAGADRMKCNGDTLHLAAPAGFINYAWLPNYNISAVNGMAVVVNPSVDTSYVIKAEKTPGCFAMDTVHITVYHSPGIQLGNDTSLCAGQSLTVSAGSGFTGYLWSNGNTGMQNTFSASGTYTVKAVTVQGCTSYDTLRILNLYALPNVALDHRRDLCTGTTRTLDAGAFAGYRWQDGSVSRTFTAAGMGTYYVQVQDSHGCMGSDTTKIITFTPLPTDFLPADTTICNYETVTLQPLKTYAAYRWNNNSPSATIAVAAAGTYWLQVRDSKGCEGRDSITVQVKECLKGLFVPSAFTPNGDGKNDQLKALLYGSVTKFAFTIYNRFGQAVFHTTTAGAAWDGTINGATQPVGAYIWVCTYALGSEPSNTERGTLVLIR